MNPIKKTFRIGVLTLPCALTSACISAAYGTPLITDGLVSLELGQSTCAAILPALGRQPRGNGSMHVSQSPEPPDILLYEHVKSDSKNTVLMLDRHYDGYLWFASSERIRKQGISPVLDRPQQAKVV